MRQKSKHYLLSIYNYMKLLGIDPVKTFLTIGGLPSYLKSFILLKLDAKRSNTGVTEFPFGTFRPFVEDRKAKNGTILSHYFHQDLLVARRIFENNPKLHVDIGSRVDGFLAHVASFRQIEAFDLRKIDSHIPNVLFKQLDIMKLEKSYYGYCDSLSCLHALEHFGLGRYGDDICYDGHVIGFDNLTKILKKGGHLYLSVPIGKQRIEFNAHRIFSVKYLLGLIKNKYTLDRFSYVDDAGVLHENISLNGDDIDRNYGCTYGLGVFEMTKI